MFTDARELKESTMRRELKPTEGLGAATADPLPQIEEEPAEEQEEAGSTDDLKDDCQGKDESKISWKESLASSLLRSIAGTTGWEMVRRGSGRSGNEDDGEEEGEEEEEEEEVEEEEEEEEEEEDGDDVDAGDGREAGSVGNPIFLGYTDDDYSFDDDVDVDMDDDHDAEPQDDGYDGPDNDAAGGVGTGAPGGAAVQQETDADAAVSEPDGKHMPTDGLEAGDSTWAGALFRSFPVSLAVILAMLGVLLAGSSTPASPLVALKASARPPTMGPCAPPPSPSTSSSTSSSTPTSNLTGLESEEEHQGLNYEAIPIESFHTYQDLHCAHDVSDLEEGRVLEAFRASLKSVPSNVLNAVLPRFVFNQVSMTGEAEDTVNDLDQSGTGWAYSAKWAISHDRILQTYSACLGISGLHFRAVDTIAAYEQTERQVVIGYNDINCGLLTCAKHAITTTEVTRTPIFARHVLPFEQQARMAQGLQAMLMHQIANAALPSPSSYAYHAVAMALQLSGVVLTPTAAPLG